MSPKTNFRILEALEPGSVTEALDMIGKAGFEDDTAYAKEVEIKFVPEANEFEGDFGGRKARFTKSGFLRFCGMVGIPAGFAEKVPNELLLTNLAELIDGFESKKIKMVYRGGVVVSAMKPNRCWLHPKTILEHLQQGLITREMVADRIIVTDDGVVANAYETPTTQFNLQDSKFDVGTRLDYGYEKAGLFKAAFFSRNHACLNIAYAIGGKTLKGAIQYERVKAGEQLTHTFGRFHEKVVAPALLGERLKAAHGAIQGRKVLDTDYVDIYKRLAKVVGHEPALGVFQLDEDRHDMIVQIVKTRKALVANDPNVEVEAVPLDEMETFKLFDKLTSLAHSYKGEERLFIEELGGSLLPL